MTKKEAYFTIAKHIFIAYKTYAENFDPLIILANNEDEAREKAAKYLNTGFVTICKLKSKNKDGVHFI